MILTFLSPTTTYPIGGVAVLFEYANALTARGHTVQVVHHEIFGTAVSSREEIAWFDFDPAVIHHFIGLEDPDPEDIPSADIFFGFTPDGRLQPRFGLPVVLIQGHGMFAEAIEAGAYRAPCPKVCVARWLVDIGVDRYAVPAEQLVHIPYGLHCDRYRIVRPIDQRPRTVTLLHHTHRKKGLDVALEAVADVRARHPDVEFVTFGTHATDQGFPDWIRHHESPPLDRLVEEIYNETSIFVCASHVEGFGLSAVEAMACGAALVTTSNGGSADYAFHEHTALVSQPGDAVALADNIVRLLDDDAERIALASAGHDLVQRYDWSLAATQMEDFLEAYLATPERFAAPFDQTPRAAHVGYSGQ